MINIELNGSKREMEDHSTVSDLLRMAKVECRFCAVELNLEIVPKDQYDARFLKDGDKLEVVTLVGGG